MRQTLATPGDSSSAMLSRKLPISGSSGPGASTVMSAWAMSVSTGGGTSARVAAAMSVFSRSAASGEEAAGVASSAPTNRASSTVFSMNVDGSWEAGRGAWKKSCSTSPRWRRMVSRALRASGKCISGERSLASVSVRHGEATQPASRIAHWSGKVASTQVSASLVAARTSMSSTLPRPIRPADSPMVISSVGSKPSSLFRFVRARTPTEPSLFRGTGSASSNMISWRS